MQARVIKAYTAQYPDPVQLNTGDPVTLGVRDSDYPGWVWGTSMVTGKAGWIPEQFLEVNGDTGRALRAYSAVELSVAEGELVEVLEELLDWALVVSAKGRGWVPLGNLARSISPADLPL